MKVIDREWINKNIDAFRSQKVVVITGAGISCPSGIPDYRSREGVFNVREKGLKGSDYFDHRFSLQPETRTTYLPFIAKFKEQCDAAQPSVSHHALNYLKKFNRLRVYSQNVCGLEERAGLRATKKMGTELVLLHGDLKTLKCTYCGYKTPFTTNEVGAFKKGEEVPCERCAARKGRCSMPRGVMHTTIVHYNEPHPDPHHIGSVSERDKDLTLLIVVGTSLKVYGIKRLARHFLRNLNGTSFFVSLDEPRGEFKEAFQNVWKGDCDEFFKTVRQGLEMNRVSECIRRMSLEEYAHAEVPQARATRASILAQKAKDGTLVNTCVQQKRPPRSTPKTKPVAPQTEEEEHSTAKTMMPRDDDAKAKVADGARIKGVVITRIEVEKAVGNTRPGIFDTIRNYLTVSRKKN